MQRTKELSNVTPPLNKKVKKRKGFTLIEMSIVLVIIGLVTGVVLVGNDLVQAAKLRDLTSKIQEYETKVNIFRNKYGCIPGDCKNIESIFGSRGGGGCRSGSDWATYNSPATCNGNGNGLIGKGGIGGAHYHERVTFWSHLSHAGLMDKIYTGVGDGSFWGGHTGVTLPNDWQNAATTMHTNGNANYFTIGNIGSWSGGQVSQHYESAAFTVSEMMALDTKFDDGRPKSGDIRSSLWYGYVTPRCTSNNTGSTARYLIDNPGELCSLQMKANF